MKQFILLIALLLAISIAPSKIYAQDTSAGSSAILANASLNEDKTSDVRAMALTNVFKKYNSPLAPYATSYVKYADEYNVDWKLLPAISGVESTFGRFLLEGTHNAYGWGGGTVYFDSWDDGIQTIDKTLRQNYMDRWGATDVWTIAPIYAESKTWAPRVASFMDEINQEYIKLSSNNLTITL